MCWLTVISLTTACADKSNDQVGSGRIAEVASTLDLRVPGTNGLVDTTPAVLAPSQSLASSLASSLARAAGGADGQRYTAYARSVADTARAVGLIVGRVAGGDRKSRDTVIVPTHDLAACQPFTQRAVPSLADGVGNAVVWLMGVPEGPTDAAPKRVALRLAGCRLEPRVLRVPMGATLMVASGDVMSSRLRFVDVADPTAVRATVMLNDAGQVVPTSGAAAKSGLVEVRDDLHPWVRAWIAVAPHPFVAVTAADGIFRFDGVPAGRYTLVAWSEALGARSRELRVTAGVETRVEVAY